MYIHGQAMSMGFAIATCGDYRYATKRTTFMYHEMSWDTGQEKMKYHEQELKEGISEAKNIKLENNIIKKYEDYVSAYKQFYGNEDYDTKMVNEKGVVIPASTWAVKESALLKKIKIFNTYEEQLIKESEKKKSEQLKKQNKKSKTKIP